jgi:hypothetical protein
MCLTQLHSEIHGFNSALSIYAYDKLYSKESSRLSE